jgi:hypothetical protein
MEKIREDVYVPKKCDSRVPWHNAARRTQHAIVAGARPAESVLASKPRACNACVCLAAAHSLWTPPTCSPSTISGTVSGAPRAAAT